jgi:RNA recognition motif-containing protein
LWVYKSKAIYFLLIFIMNIFVANLNFRLTDDDLREVFTQFGEVSSAKVIMDRESGRSKGFGFVEMPNDNEANEAISQLASAEIEGKTITVKEALPRENRSSGGGGFRGGNDNRGGGNRRF